MKHLLWIAMIFYCGAIGASMAEDAAAYPAVTRLSASYVRGRQITVSWDNPALSTQTTLYCDVRRDGEIVYTGILRQNDSETGGQTWYGTTNQYFKDDTIWPGRTHEYSVVYRDADGNASEAATVSRAVPLPEVREMTASHVRSRFVQTSLSINSLISFTDTEFDIYRDNVLLATVGLGSSGTTASGDTWSLNSYWLHYSDNNAVPGATHTYRIMTRLFAGMEFSTTADAAVSMPSPSDLKIHANHWSGRSSSVGIYNTNFEGYPERFFVIDRDGVEVARFGLDSSGTKENGDYWQKSGTVHYFYDVNGVPGTTHEYRVTVHLYPGGPTVENMVSVSVPMPAFNSGNLRASVAGVRKITVDAAAAGLFLNFPDRKYQIYRNNVKMHEFTVNTSGDLENGDSWQAASGAMRYMDNNAAPGVEYVYRVVITLYEDGPTFTDSIAAAIPLPVLTPESLAISTYQSRRVQIKLGGNALSSYPERNFTIYRDGILLAQFAFGTSATKENGDIWAGSSDYFVDANAIPGSTHIYRLAVTLYDGGPTVEASASISIPMPVLQSDDLAPYFYQGRRVRLSLGKNQFSYFPDRYFEIYRDDEKLCEFSAGTSGATENGNQWAQAAYSDVFHDVNGVPGSTHVYRLVVTLFAGGPSVEASASISIPLPDFNSNHLQANYRGGRELEIRIDNASFSWFPERRYQILRDGICLGEFEAQSGGAGDGNYLWNNGSSSNWFYDRTIVPNIDYRYEIAVTLFDGGPRVLTQIAVRVPVPIRPDSLLNIKHSGHGGALLIMNRCFRLFPDLTYTIYRDGREIAKKVKDGTQGTDENGNSWYFNTTSVFYADNNITVGQRYEYRVVFFLYDGCEYEYTAIFTPNDLSPVLFNSNYIPVLKKYPSGKYLLGVTINVPAMDNEAQLFVEISGINAVFQDTNLPRIVFSPELSFKPKFYNFYVIAPANTDFENDNLDVFVNFVQ